MKCAVKINEHKKIKSEATNNAVEFMMLSFVQYLGDKRGWKQKTICEAIKYCINHAENIAAGNITIQAVKENVWEKYGFQFTEDGRIEVEER